MNWLKKAWSRFRYVVHIDGDAYLVRYRLLWLPWVGNIYLHHILRSDSDREPHDHPFDFTSIVLWGRYLEHLYVFMSDGRTLHHKWEHRSMFSMRRRNAYSLHRVELLDGPVWTLFIRGPKYREWGFQTPHGWVKHEWFEDYKKVVERMDKLVQTGKYLSYMLSCDNENGSFKAVVEAAAGIETIPITLEV